MPAAGDRDDIADLKAALLNFVVREVRGHADDLGPLSDDLTRAITDGARTAVAESLRDFETRRLEALAAELWRRIEPDLKDKTDAIARQLGASLTQELQRATAEMGRQVDADADARVRSAVTEAFGEPQVRQSVNGILLGVANLQTTLEAILDQDQEGAQASAAEGAAAARATLQHTPATRRTEVVRDMRRLRPILITTGVVLVVLMLALLGFEAWRMGVLPGSSAEPAVADRREAAVAAAPAAEATQLLPAAALRAVEDARTVIADARTELQRRADAAGQGPNAAAAKGRLKTAEDLSQRIGLLSQQVEAARTAHNEDGLWKAGGEARELGRQAARLTAAPGTGPS